MKNILFVSIAFPPKNDPEAIQAGKIFKYLSRVRDFNFTVLTSSNPTLYMPVDEKLNRLDKGFRKKIEIPIFESKISNFLLRKIWPGGIDYPDSKFSFHLQWKKAFRRLPAAPELIYSRSNPLSSAIMGYRLQKRLNVPWVMHLSDPWVDSPIHSYSKKQSQYHRRWERECFSTSRYICVTSVAAQHLYRKKYPEFADKILYFPNVYDSETIVKTPLDFSSKLRIVYTGGLQSARSPASFIAAVKMLESRIGSLESRLEVIFAGPMDSHAAKCFREQSRVVRHIGMISYDDAVALSQSAHILLAIDVQLPAEAPSIFFPSKLLDYFLTKRKIMVLTQRESQTAQIVRGYNAEIFEPQDTNAIATFLIQSMKAFEDKSSDYFLSSEVPAFYDAELQTKRLADLFHTLVK
jgi:glycosyltransferase involved in cell wall biosynthesis